MADSEAKSDRDKRTRIERRSLTDTRSEEERQLTRERRSQIDRRPALRASSLRKTSFLFLRSVLGVPGDESSRHIFGISSGEDVSEAIPTSFGLWTGSKV